MMYVMYMSNIIKKNNEKIVSQVTNHSWQLRDQDDYDH